MDDPIPGTSRMTETEAFFAQMERERERKSNERRQKDKERKRKKRNEETYEEKEKMRKLNAERERQKRSKETDEETRRRRQIEAQRQSQRLINETNSETEERRRRDSESHSQRYNALSEDMRRLRVESTQERNRQRRAQSRYLGRRREMPGRHYMGLMNMICQICHALFWLCEKNSGNRNQPKYHLCCKKGEVQLRPLEEMPPCLQELFDTNTANARDFRQNIRAYNSLLSFTSCGAKVEEFSVANTGVFTYKIHGEMYHLIGSLLPSTSQQAPNFIQLYFFDTDHETDNRMNLMPTLNRSILERLQNIIRNDNPWIQLFKNAIESITHNITNINLRIRTDGKDLRIYNRPTTSDVAAIIPGDNFDADHRDIILKGRSDELQRISDIHPAYDPWSYVLLFPKGEFGWSPGMRRTTHQDKTLTQLDFYCFRIHYRQGNFTLHRGGRLFLQFVVDVYARIEQSRLRFIKTHQNELRAQTYQGLVDAINDNHTLENIGHATILPSTFYNSPRFMIQNYQDAMAIVRVFGKPDLFITFTCNPKWKEIIENLLPGQKANDRPDLIARVFHQKLKEFLDDLIKNSILGRVKAYTYTIEFQKRGLPHCHILLILHPEDKIRNSDEIDEVVSAEIPDPNEFPLAYATVTTSMIHGPCGGDIPSPCMKDGVCTKGFPKQFQRETQVPTDGYPTYRRRDDGRKVIVERGNRRIEVDNRFIVPHNLWLCTKYDAHINVEVCTTVRSVKYIYKYINKGPDKANVEMSAEQMIERNRDEIKCYLDARYLSSSEACWRIFEYGLHENKPAVVRLDIHLPGRHNVTFDANANREVVLNNVKRTKLMAWFDYNRASAEGRHLLYTEFPTFYTWNPSNHGWQKRKNQLSFETIGRMYLVTLKDEQKYYLRMLLTQVRGARSFEDLRTVDGVLRETFKDAAEAMGLLESDDEWDKLLAEAITFQYEKQLRALFANILVHCRPKHPGLLWEKYKDDLSKDVVRTATGQIDQSLNDLPDGDLRQRIIDNVLTEIDNHLISLGSNLKDFTTMPQIVRGETELSRLIAEEISENTDELMQYVDHRVQQMNADQRAVLDEIVHCIESRPSRVFFLDGPGGTGKTFVYNTLLSSVRSRGRIAIAVASSGIAALLLDKGRTAHSRFKIPIDIHESSVCYINAEDDLAQLIRSAALFIWDEAPMMSRYVFEAVDRTFRDIMKKYDPSNRDKPFGGKIFVFGGDFRQILPVVPKGTDCDIINRSIKRSRLWRNIQMRHLTINMRLNQETDPEQRDFASYLLRIGDNREPNIDGIIRLPPHLCRDIHEFESFIDSILSNLNDWTILAAKNEDVDRINQTICGKVDGEHRVYKSADSLGDQEDQHHSHLYPVEYLNSLNLSGLPPHELSLKIGSPIMLLRNLNPALGLCNGTQLKCLSFRDHMIEAEIITGTHRGDKVFLHRMTMQPSENLLPITFRRRQFPIRPSYAMTMNKAQGQTLNKVALFLDNHVFSHGQLYVAMSRVTSSNNLVIFTHRDNNGHFITKNIVYQF